MSLNKARIQLKSKVSKYLTLFQLQPKDSCNKVSAQILKSLSTIIQRQFSDFASWSVQRIVEASTTMGSLEEVSLAQALWTFPDSSLITAAMEAEEAWIAASTLILIVPAGGHQGDCEPSLKFIEIPNVSS